MNPTTTLQVGTTGGALTTSQPTLAEVNALIDAIDAEDHLALAESESERFVSEIADAWTSVEAKASQYLVGFGVVAALVGTDGLPPGSGPAGVVARIAVASFGVLGAGAVVLSVQALSVRPVNAVNPAVLLTDPNRSSGHAFSAIEYRRWLLKARWDNALQRGGVQRSKARALKWAERLLCACLIALAVGIVASAAAGYSAPP